MHDHPTCSADGCDRPTYAKTFCRRDYSRWYRHGSPAKRSRRQPLEPLFWAKVDKGDGTGCWLWTAYIDRDGYGLFSNKQVGTQRAYRYAYELLVGPIPEGLQLDHVKANGCTSRACVKAIEDEFGPAHLEPVTSGENTRRGVKAQQTHCKRGHPFDEANTYIKPNGNRTCRKCHAAVEARRRTRKRSP